MKVLYLTDSLSELDGVGRYAMGLIGALEQEVAEFGAKVLLARKHRPTSSAVPERWEPKVALPPDYFFYMKPSRFWPSLWASTLAVARAARGFDLVHAIKDYPHSLVALKGAQLAGKPCVATAHGTYTVQPLLDERHAERARKTYAGFAGMISVSAYTARRLGEVLGSERMPKRLATIPNCVDLAPLEQELQLGERPWHGKRFTLGIGETKERKGHHLALAGWIRAAENFPDLHHFLVGRRSDDDYEARLHRMVSEAGLSDRVHFLGNITEEEKVDLLQRCELFLHTPVTAADGGFEGFGIVYLEASACGKPVIGTLECGAEDAIRDGETGYLVAPEAPAVAGALDSILRSDWLASELGERGRAHARANTWAENARAVHRLYRDVLGETPGSTGEDAAPC